MRLKLNTTKTPSTAINGAPTTPASGIKLSFGRSLSMSSAGTGDVSTSLCLPAGPRTNGPVTSKKRARVEEEIADIKGDLETQVSRHKKQARSKPVMPKIRLPSLGNSGRKGSMIKLRTASSAALTPVGVPRLKIKAKGKPPPRPIGVAYDSEAEDAEEDPASEDNLVLRMQLGDDCDYLRKAIEERRIGLHPGQGGADIALRFFARETRRAVLYVQSRCYAVALVDLPCIIESLKSWDKRGWLKSADICQMLVVFAQVDSEDMAKTIRLPTEMDEQSWQWPDGLTPPMHNARKRRFRKRVSYHTIEAAEDEVERLLAEDERARSTKGHTSYEILDLDRLRAEDYDSDVVPSESGGEDIEDVRVTTSEQAGLEEEEDEEAAAERLQMELDLDDDEEDIASRPDHTAPVRSHEDEVSSRASAPSGQVISSIAMPDTNHANLIVQEGKPSPAVDEDEVEVEDDHDDEDGDDEDDDDEEDYIDDDANDDEQEEDEEAREQGLFMAQQCAEITDLNEELAQTKQKLEATLNPTMRQRLLRKVEAVELDLEVKRRAIGIGGEDE